MSEANYDKAALIQKGEVEPEDYDVVVASIDKMPISMLPGLLGHVARACVTRHVFVSVVALFRFIEHVLVFQQVEQETSEAHGGKEAKDSAQY